MTAPVILLCFFLAFCPLSVGTPLTCPPPFLNESAQQGSGRLCATLQLQTKLPCPSVNLSVRENEKLNPEKWHLKSLSLKVENTCSFMVFELDKERERFPGGFYSSIAVNSIDTQSEFLCVCKKLHIRNRRTPTFNDFMAKHLVEIPENPSDEDWQRIWDDASKYREQKNSNIPRRQSFMDRNKFNSRFTRDFRIKASDGRILYRSENKMRIYDVTNNGGTLRTVPRNGYVVAGLDNNNRPVHFEAVPKEYEEHLEKMKPGQTVSIGRKVGASNLPRGVGRTVEIIEEVVEPVAEGEGIAMTVIGTTAAATSAATVFTSILHVLTLFLI